MLDFPESEFALSRYAKCFVAFNLHFSGKVEPRLNFLSPHREGIHSEIWGKCKVVWMIFMGMAIDFNQGAPNKGGETSPLPGVK